MAIVTLASNHALTKQGIGEITWGINLSDVAKKIDEAVPDNADIDTITLKFNGTAYNNAILYAYNEYAHCGLVNNDADLIKNNSGDTTGTNIFSYGPFEIGNKATVNMASQSKNITTYFGTRSPHSVQNTSYSRLTVGFSSKATYKKTYTFNLYLDVSYTIPTYKVTTSVNDSNGGTVSGGGTYDRGTSVTITATPKSGWRFSHWEDNTSNTNPTRTFTVTSNVSYKAVFIKQCVITVWGGVYGTVTGSGTYDYGTEVTISFTSTSLTTFKQWNDGNTENPRKIIATQDITYEVDLNFNRYKITVVDGAIIIGSSPIPFEENGINGYYASYSNLQIRAIDKIGYTFTRWSGDTDRTEKTFNTSVNKDATYIANFSENKYTINFNGNGNTGGSTDSITVEYNDLVTLTNGFTKTGYTFLGWATSANGPVVYNDKQSVSRLTATSGGTVTLYAIWKIKTYIITVKSNNDSYGTVTGGGSYNYGDSATLTATPATGYKFVKWSDGETSASRTVIVTENVTYTAVFEKITATIFCPSSIYGTANLYNKNGEDVSEQSSFNYGEELTLVFIPEKTYKFINFTFQGHDNSISIPLGDIYENPITFSVIGSGTIDIFVVCQPKETYGVTLENIIIYKEDGNIVNAEGVVYSQYYEGTVLELKPDLSEPMHQFVRWGGDISGTEIPKTYTVTKDSYLRAILKEVQMKFKSVKILHHSTSEVASPTNPLVGGQDQAIVQVKIALE